MIRHVRDFEPKENEPRLRAGPGDRLRRISPINGMGGIEPFNHSAGSTLGRVSRRAIATAKDIRGHRHG